MLSYVSAEDETKKAKRSSYDDKGRKEENSWEAGEMARETKEIGKRKGKERKAILRFCFCFEEVDKWQ